MWHVIAGLNPIIQLVILIICMLPVYCYVFAISWRRAHKGLLLTLMVVLPTLIVSTLVAALAIDELQPQHKTASSSQIKSVEKTFVVYPYSIKVRQTFACGGNLIGSTSPTYPKCP